MPTRFWILVGVIVALLVAGFVAVVVLVPRDDTVSDDAGDEATTPLADGVGAPSLPAASSDRGPADLDPALRADMVAYVAARQTDLPETIESAEWVAVELASVTLSAAGIEFDHTVDFDANNFYGSPTPRPIVPEFEVGECGAFTCYRFTDALAPAVCSDPELESLLERGAAAFVVFNDRNGLQVGRQRVTGDDCARLAE